MTTYYSGWLIPEHERSKLLAIFNPKYPRVYAHHITLQYDVPPDEPPPTLTRGKIIGYADDGAIEALVVSIGGTPIRPDGETYHITWSLIRGLRHPMNSKELIRDGGYIKFLHPKMIDIVPAIMES